MGNCASGEAKATKKKKSTALSDLVFTVQNRPRLRRVSSISSQALSSAQSLSSINSTWSLERTPSGSSLKQRANADSPPSVFHCGEATRSLWLAPHVPRRPSDHSYLAPIKLWCRVAQRANLSAGDSALVLAYFVAPKIRFSLEDDVVCYEQTRYTQEPMRHVKVTVSHRGRDRAITVLLEDNASNGLR